MTPYDEGQAYIFLDAMIDLFADAGRIPKPVPDAYRQNLHGMIFTFRWQFDVCNGESFAQSSAAHLAEIRAGLGLPPAQPPVANLTADAARQVVMGTANQFPQLLAVFPTDQQASDASTALLEHTIRHLSDAGFQVARQRNPSGLVSGDKLCLVLDGSWQAFDIFSLGFAGRATTVQFVAIGGADPVPDGGIPD